MDERRVNWTVIEKFEKNGIVVEVSESDARRPRYTARIGWKGEHNTMPHLRFFVEGQGKVRVSPISAIVAELLAQAEKFVEARAQVNEDKYIEERLERETRQVEREGKKRRSSGYKGHGKGAGQ